jgi:hypothetical protein
VFDKPSLNRISNNVTTRPFEVALALHDERMESCLERVARSPAAAIGVLRIDPVDMLHRVGQVVARAVENEVVVVAHLAAGKDADFVTPHGFADGVLKEPPIVIVFVNR